MAQPPAKPSCRVPVHHSVRRTDLPKREVVRPPGHEPVEPSYHDLRVQQSITCCGQGTEPTADALHACRARARADVGTTGIPAIVASNPVAAEGWAFAYRKYSRRYVAEETAAKAARRGIWRGEVVAPWEWRKGKRLAGARPAAEPGSGRCDIKGNIGKSGARIYHVPGGRYYDRTRIDTSKGERWFCSEGKARTAGWRRSRQ